PTAFITDLGTAYRASGRAKPIMDGFAFHPYGENSSVSPEATHPASTSIGLADYDKLVGLLGTAFDGTGPLGSTLPIVSDADGTPKPAQAVVKQTIDQIHSHAVDCSPRPLADTTWIELGSTPNSKATTTPHKRNHKRAPYPAGAWRLIGGF